MSNNPNWTFMNDSSAIDQQKVIFEVIDIMTLPKQFI